MAAHMATIAASQSAQSRAGTNSNPQSFPNQLPHVRRVSYGATSSQSSPRAPNIIEEEDGEGDVTLRFDTAYQLSDVEDEIQLGVTWQYLSRLYLLIPLFTVLFLVGLIIIISFAWPPSPREREEGQTYPHPFFWKPLILGIFASCTVQTLRVPTWVIISWCGILPAFTTFLSTTTHTILHELLRLASVTIIIRSPSSGFHSSYYLGLGWGIAEATWGIVQGYEQLALYEDTLKAGDGNGEVHMSDDESDMGLERVYDALEMDREAVTDLERKVELLERARARRDLEEVIGVPFPTIPLPLHLLWRIDTLLLNLGLTLLLSAFYFDPFPLYEMPDELLPPFHSSDQPSRYLWPVWACAAVLHIIISLMWKIVGRIGIGSITWGGLIVALGTVFAGLGAWGGLV